MSTGTPVRSRRRSLSSLMEALLESVRGSQRRRWLACEVGPLELQLQGALEQRHLHRHHCVEARAHGSDADD